ncbi:MAG: MerR family transcriptional regulator [Elusimicrobia bacterium]|nr:MerR family transcriptional regulator [Elusimicrobiota bacterium]
MLVSAPLPDKEFFTMGEACRLAQVASHTLRYWETRVGLPKPARRASGHRRYTRQDMETILLIKDLLQRRKLTLAGARKALLERRRGANQPGAVETPGPRDEQTLKLLREVRKEIQSLIQELKS